MEKQQVDIHDISNNLDKALERLRKRTSKRDKEIMEKFINELYVQDLSDSRRYYYVQRLITLTDFLDKDWVDVDKKELKKIVSRINKEDYAKTTKGDFRIVLKKFFQIIEGYDWNSKKYPEKTDFLKTSRVNTSFNFEDLLTKEEIDELIRHENLTKYKAMISVLAEGGLRIGEMLSLRMDNIKLDRYGCIVNVPNTCKTGTRPVRLVGSTNFLLDWINQHPQKDNGESFLWVTKKFERNKDGKIKEDEKGRRKIIYPRTDYDTFRIHLKRLAKRAGVTKPVNPHAFRHYCASRLAQQLTEAQLCHYMGWKIGSDMPGVYVHLSGRDVDDKILQLHGKKPQEESKEEFGEKECERCGFTHNKYTASYCRKCTAPLTNEAKLSSLNQDKEMKEAIEKLRNQVKFLTEDVEKILEKN